MEVVNAEPFLTENQRSFLDKVQSRINFSLWLIRALRTSELQAFVFADRLVQHFLPSAFPSSGFQAVLLVQRL